MLGELQDVFLYLASTRDQESLLLRQVVQQRLEVLHVVPRVAVDAEHARVVALAQGQLVPYATYASLELRESLVYLAQIAFLLLLACRNKQLQIV